MKFILALDSFKGSLSSNDANSIVENAVKEVFPKSECTKIAIADGGEGTLEAINNQGCYEKIMVNVTNPIGEQIKGFYLKKQNKAVIEMAVASGLAIIEEKKRNPKLTTSKGTGEIIAHALKNGCNEIYIGIGGSATNDGGIGAMSALGFKFVDKNGNDLEGIGENLAKIEKIEDDSKMPEIDSAKFIVMCDVTNPLTGKNGASYVYGYQKGGDDVSIAELESGMVNYKDKLQSFFKSEIDNVPGMGAAGGMGAALYCFLNASMKSGIDVILDINEFDKKVAEAELVITGEGMTDYQSMCGKVISGIAARCKGFNVPVVVVSGSLGKDSEKIYDSGINTMEAAVCNITSLNNAMDNAEVNLKNAAIRLFRAIKTGMELVKK